MNTKANYAETQSAGGIAVIKRNPLAMTLDEAFPQADAMCFPLGNKVLIQLRSPKKKVGNIVLTEETQAQEKFITTVGKVIAMGNIAYRRRDNGEPWPEGVWVAVGDFVRVPKFGGDRWEVFVDPSEDRTSDATARFAIYNDHDLFSKITGDPMSFRDYV